MDDNDVEEHGSSQDQEQEHKVSLLYEGIKTVQEQTLYKCKVCEMTFDVMSEARAHARTHMTPKTYKCDECGRTYWIKYNLDRHLESHTGKEGYICKTCKIGYITKASFQSHVGKHLESNSYKLFHRLLVSAGVPMDDNDEEEHDSSQDQEQEHKVSLLYDVIKTVQAQTLYKCKVCDMTFDVMSKAQAHARSHMTPKTYKCDECGRTFWIKYNLDRHLESHTGKEGYICNICKTGFITRTSFQSHVKKHEEDNPYKSFYRPQMFAGESMDDDDVEEHDNSQDQEQEHTVSLLYEVIKIDEEQTLHKCKVCEMTFDVKSEAQAHARSHMTPKTYNCDECGRTYWIKYNLGRHLESHTGRKGYICDICKVGFITRARFQSHVKKHGEDNPYKCKFCGMGFGFLVSLSEHLKQHEGTKRYSCYLCDQTFSYEVDLAEHMEIHRVLYECGKCGKSFSSKQQLRSHQKTHDDFKSIFVEKTFKDQSCLPKHLKTLTSGDPYQCEPFGQDFNYSRKDEEHQHVHTHEKQYKYEKDYYERKILREQETIHDGENAFKCPECKKSYGNIILFTRHLRTHPGLENQPLVGPAANTVIQSPTSSGLGSHTGIQPSTSAEHETHTGTQSSTSYTPNTDTNVYPESDLDYLWAEYRKYLQEAFLAESERQHVQYPQDLKKSI